MPLQARSITFDRLPSESAQTGRLLWSNVLLASYARRRSVPWIDRNFERLLRITREGFSHKLLQVPHEHMAAYHRWIMPRVARESV